MRRERTIVLAALLMLATPFTPAAAASGHPEIFPSSDPVAGPPTQGRVLRVEVGSLRAAPQAPSRETRATFSLTVDAVSRDGSGFDGTAVAIDLASAEQYPIDVSDGVGSADLPEGRYAIGAVMETGGSLTLAYRPDVSLSEATTIELDARSARRVAVGLDGSAARQVMATVFAVQQTSAGNVKFPDSSILVDDLARQPVYVTATGASEGLSLRVHTTWLGNGTNGEGEHLYNLLSASTGRLPARPTFRVRATELAHVHTRYDAQSTEDFGAAGAFPGSDSFAGVNIAYSYFAPVRLPDDRIEHYTPGVLWVGQFLHGPKEPGPGEVETLPTAVTYPRAGRYLHSWNRAPVGPAFPRLPYAFYSAERDADDTLAVSVPLCADAGTRHACRSASVGVTGGTELYRLFGDGPPELIASHDHPGELDRGVDVGPERHRYRLSVNAHRNVSWSRYATEQRITWTFTSGHDTQSRELPLLAVRYGIELDRYGRATAEHPTLVQVWIDANSAEHRPQIDSLRLQASYDDGATWHAVPVRVDAGQARAILHPPRNNGFVSLRAVATDEAGNTVDQATIRAFGLKP